MSLPGDLPPGPANWATLTPISFLVRTAEVYPRRIGIIHGQRRITAHTALRLARYFGTSERFWMNLQLRYDIEIEKDRLERS